MQIKEAKIFNFGKLQNKKVMFSPGINVVYGKNEAGKTTLHTFLTAMLFGLEKGRGRASASDKYSQYEPWHAPSFYSGSLRFLVDGQPFYLERNFYTKEKSDYLRNESDGEELDVAYGDLTMLLGGIGKETYANTYDIPQSGAATGAELIKLLSEYLAKAADGTEEEVSVSDAVAALNGRKKELLLEQKKSEQAKENERAALLVEKRLLTEECEKLRVSVGEFEREHRELLLRQQKEEQEYKEQLLRQQQEFLFRQQEEQEYKERLLARQKETEKRKSRLVLFLSVLSFVLAVIFFFLGKEKISSLFVSLETIFAILAVIGAAVFCIRQRKQKSAGQRYAEEQSGNLEYATGQNFNPRNEAGQIFNLKNDAGQAKKSDSVKHAIQYAEKMLSDLKDSLQEKETRLFNIEEELAAKETKSEPERRREEDILALDMAAQEIERISKAYYEDRKDGLNAEISRLVSAFTKGAYDSVRLDDKGKLQIFTEGKEVEPQALSRGTLEQIYLALRIAVGNVVANEEKLPVLFDDAFALYDDERLSHTLKTLSEMENQMIIFTCQDREERMLKQLKLPYQKITL